MKAFAILVLSLATGIAGAAPEADLWQRWSEHDPDSEASIDHGAWSTLLQAHLVTDEELDLNRVRYADFDDDDRQRLRAYIEQLEATEISDYARPVQRAFWLNLYNAVTVDLVVREYPVDSIRDIGGGLMGNLFGGGPWDDKQVTVEGTKLSLNDIEHRILRPIWDDGLTHYGVNCASVGCPNLLKTAFTGEDVNRRLRDNARAYVNSPRGVRFDGDRLIVSSIYDWFRADFGGSETGVISHLRQFAEPELSARLDATAGIDDHAYDWALNDVE